MCGIIGAFAFAIPDMIWTENEIDSMVQAISHRGPDDRGKYVEPGLFLGHVRLSIIDLSLAGHQPMASANDRYVISYNGEMYNFKVLRSELEKLGHEFHSHSDTEVLLTAWQEWGEGCLDRLDGIFAFALFDRQEKTLYLVRDHFGIKPLFYWTDGSQLVFASELLAMFGSIVSYPDVNAEDLDAYFTFNYLYAPRTGLAGANQLPPAHLLKVNHAGVSLRRYWQLDCSQEIKVNKEDELVEQFRDLVSSSVISQMVSDAPLGLFLSGGLDSFSVACAAVSSGATPKAFTLGFHEAALDETKEAGAYAHRLGISRHSCEFSWTETEIHETLGAMRELLADASCFPMYQLSRYARQQVTVALSGDGGDELLAGYDTYRAGAVTPYIRILPGWLRGTIKYLTRYLPSTDQRYGLRMVIERLLTASEQEMGRDHASFRRIFTAEQKRRLYTPEFYAMVKDFDPIAEYASLITQIPQSRSYLTGRQYADLIFHLPSVLAKVDRMSMAHGLEVRVPLLRKQVVEFCMNLPDNSKRRYGKGKRILREMIANEAPKGALNRSKAGFLPPVDKWFRENGAMTTVFGDYLDKAKTANVGWLKWNEVEKLWAGHRRGEQEAGFVLLGILQFLNWRFKCRK
jgi:asparagine synthase (glutamine-hydrolysing)